MYSGVWKTKGHWTRYTFCHERGKINLHLWIRRLYRVGQKFGYILVTERPSSPSEGEIRRIGFKKIDKRSIFYTALTQRICVNDGSRSPISFRFWKVSYSWYDRYFFRTLVPPCMHVEYFNVYSSSIVNEKIKLQTIIWFWKFLA